MVWCIRTSVQISGFGHLFFTKWLVFANLFKEDSFMEKKKKSGAIHQLLDYAGNNKKQLYLSTFLATLGELFGMAPFIAVSLLVAELFNKTATIQNVCILFAVALGGQILKLWLTYQSSFMSHKATYKISVV